MKTLKDRIRAQIETTGPMSVADYMALCLFDPEAGYYTTREPFGAEGDFTTAPEISQMFGELCAVWLYTAWKASGAPKTPVVAEIGPGRGTLMKDMLRTWAKIDPAFREQMQLVMIEASPRLSEVQRKTLGPLDGEASWIVDIGALPEGPLFILGNELFDAIPIRQYVKVGNAWRERVVGLDAAEQLAFMAGAGSADPTILPPGSENAPEGAIVELAPARNTLMSRIAERIGREGGAGLFIDYGYASPAPGDTLQAMRGHAYQDVLKEPGKADLTAHVDFFALAGAAKEQSLAAELMSQGDFLIGLGLLERAGRLGSGKNATEQQAIRNDVDRLAGPDQMGALFKALAVTPSTVAVPPFVSPH
ncbi:class I SAM-dependent methyltransferase [Nitratireductor kimnyeongensis]|uniref:Class I SAM-dependent methyltransferase n=1 Tax=Nitratireductor kimnyeongensis TaxID=430679 RepID=A0ABW0T7W0_9HYPH|nr:class I SAM-dependent methyltransferase [Nitratireductor kimnyeongensis]QZZ36084.1 class I SAM-dependent methyltransferase [Nitratireductor kimnyeongensis]